MMSGVVVIDGNAGSLTAAAIRGGDVVVHRPRRRPHRHRPEGRHVIVGGAPAR
jgi:formylmethanofuran dehydrogenase subunit C